MNARFRPRHGAAYGVKDSSDAPLAENQLIKPRRVWGYRTLIFVLMLYLINRKRSLVRIAIDKVPTSMPKTPSCDGGSPWWQKPLDSASSQKKVEKPEVMAPSWNKMKQSIGEPSPTESMFRCDRMNWTHESTFARWRILLSSTLRWSFTTRLAFASNLGATVCWESTAP